MQMRPLLAHTALRAAAQISNDDWKLGAVNVASSIATDAGHVPALHDFAACRSSTAGTTSSVQHVAAPSPRGCDGCSMLRDRVGLPKPTTKRSRYTRAPIVVAGHQGEPIAGPYDGHVAAEPDRQRAPAA